MVSGLLPLTTHNLGILDFTKRMHIACHLMCFVVFRIHQGYWGHCWVGWLVGWLDSFCLPACLLVCSGGLVGWFFLERVWGFFAWFSFGIDCLFGFSVCVSLVGDWFSCCVFVCWVFWGKHLGNKAAPREKLPIFIQWNCSCYASTQQ